VPYQVPAPDVAAAVDAPPTPIAVPAPGGRFIALLHYQAHPPVAMLARPFLRLAGLRIDPVIAAVRRTRQHTAMSVLDVSDGTDRPLRLPDGPQLSAPAWAPDGRRFAFTVDEPDGVGVWVADAAAGVAAQVPGLRVRDVLSGDPPGLGGTVRWSRDGRSLIALASPGPGAGPEPAAAADGPQTAETAGRHSQLATFQDLLRTAADEELFAGLASTIAVRADPDTGALTQLGPAGLYTQVTESPDGQYLLVRRLQRPFSFRVPCRWFARRTEVWAAAGQPVAVIADLPVSDEVPRHGVPEGPRLASWDESTPARLAWVQALDGGDPVRSAPYREQVMRLAAPFGAGPEPAFRLEHRCLGWLWLDEPGGMLVTEHDRDRRWLTSWQCDLADPSRNRVIFDLAADDAYGDPGVPVLRQHPDGARTVLQDGAVIYLRGDGAGPDGDRPFLDARNLETGETARLFRSPPDAHDQVLHYAGHGSAGQLVLWHQSRTEPPNLVVARADGAGRRTLTGFADPHPRLTGHPKRLIVTDRGDGVSLSGLLHLPPGYDAARDGPLPLVIWAYPLDYGTADTAGQVRASPRRFTRLTAADPAWFVLRGYAVLAEATMPVIGHPETMNDSYVEQITAAAAAHIRGLAELGVADPARVTVGGHSYGAFMTASLLAHTDLFTAGIARSGAYNRTLTPFGFQAERRSFWEAPQVYDLLSPFRYADKITAPLLLIHGASDANPGTYPIQSERLFQAIQGTGGTARLVLLPHEDHGYLARESVLHVLAEQFCWLQRWIG
jgi:dipeptidyl aminopeptidase/acylaminoacyl peptidase